MTPANTTQSSNIGRAASVVNLLLGIWFFVSPWVFGAYKNPNAWNGWIVGALIVILAAIRLANPGGLKIFSWWNMALGVWVFASPWIYGYTFNTGRFVNSLCIGVIVFVLSITAWSAQPRHMVPQN